MVTSKTKFTLPKDAAQNKRFAIVVSRYHEDLSQELLKGAQDSLRALGAKPENVSTHWVPGAFEIPAAARVVSQYMEVDAIICLGIILKGETSHNEYIAHEVARGVAQIHAATGIPCTFGVLTPDSLEQAKSRTGGDKGNKGAESAEAAVAMVLLIEELKKGPKKTSKSVGF